MDSFIGRGERVALQILKSVFPDAEFQIQVPIMKMVTPEIYEFYDEIYQKASVDIMVIHKNRYHAVRIQDKHHVGEKTSKKDRIQRQDMEDNGIVVIDVFERESPYLFRNILNYKSYLEILRPLEIAKVIS